MRLHASSAAPYSASHISTSQFVCFLFISSFFYVSSLHFSCSGILPTRKFPLPRTQFPERLSHLSDDVPFVDFMYLIFARLPGDSSNRWFRSLLLCHLLYLCRELWVHRNLFWQLSKDGILHGSGMSQFTTALPKPSFRAPWSVGDAVVGRGNAGWTTSKSGHPCPCQNWSQRPPAEKTGRWSLLNRPSCPPTTLSVKGLNWAQTARGQPLDPFACS